MRRGRVPHPHGWRGLAATLTMVAGLLAGPGLAMAATITVGPAARGRPLPANFLSLSLQYRTILRWTGPPGQPVDPVLLQLVRNLDPGGRPVLRVGGQGGDRTWWPIRGMRRPLGVSDDLSPRWTRAARRLAAALPARYLLQLNLEAGSPRVARVEAEHLLAGVGRSRIAAFEIGNEPDLYSSIPWYWESAGRPLPWYADRGTPVFARGPGYGPAQFVAEVLRFARVLPGDVPLAGPDLVDPSWLAAYARLLTPRSRVRILDVHSYPLVKCVTDPASARYPTIAHLLALRASRGLLTGTGPYIAQAHRDGGSFLDDELGADSCGGNAGVSNTTASALWVMDTLFAMDRAGVDGVDLHNLPGTVGGLFDLHESAGRWFARVHPIYLGALLFAQAAPAGSRLLPLAGADQARVRAWATIAPDHLVRVLLIDPGAAATLTVRPPTADRGLPAELERLRAPSVAATGGLRLAGQAFSRTSTGVLGQLHPELVRPRAGGFRLRLPAACAALLPFTPRRAGAHREKSSRRRPRVSSPRSSRRSYRRPLAPSGRSQRSAGER